MNPDERRWIEPPLDESHGFPNQVSLPRGVETGVHPMCSDVADLVRRNHQVSHPDFDAEAGDEWWTGDGTWLSIVNVEQRLHGGIACSSADSIALPGAPNSLHGHVESRLAH